MLITFHFRTSNRRPDNNLVQIKPPKLPITPIATKTPFARIVQRSKAKIARRWHEAKRGVHGQQRTRRNSFYDVLTPPERYDRSIDRPIIVDDPDEPSTRGRADPQERCRNARRRETLFTMMDRWSNRQERRSVRVHGGVGTPCVRERAREGPRAGRGGIRRVPWSHINSCKPP